MKKQILNALILIILILFSCTKEKDETIPMIIDHKSTDLDKIPVEWIQKAKTDLNIAYGHTSHGSQIITGMTGLETFKGDPYLWNSGPLEGSLNIWDQILGGDLGHNGDLDWESTTRSFLDDPRNDEYNVIMWSWCGGVSDNTPEGIDTYLEAMNQLEIDYPQVKFIYMTGHVDGSGIDGTLNKNNELIRKYCRENNKILYDFADIESYDPDGNYYLDKAVNDACDYDSDGDGTRESNWAVQWQNTHTVNQDWYNCTSAHSEPLNANLKAYAAWWLWARLAGWSGR